jgi:uncharacterized membrane protein
MLKRLNQFLDRYILPLPVRFLTFRFVILATILLLIPLLLYAGNQVLVLGINSYLNTMSVAVSSIVLLYATLGEVQQRQLAELQEKRAQEDHEHLTELHGLMLQTLVTQWQQVEDLKGMVAHLQGHSYQSPPMPAMPDLEAMHPRGAARFDAHDVESRVEASLKAEG